MSSKLREALELARKFVYTSSLSTGHDLIAADMCGKPYVLTPKNALEKIDVALSEPLRNCDVGSVDEQERRFRKYCDSNYNTNNVDAECCRCPLSKHRNACEFEWLQMPYEKEGEECR